MYVDRVYKPELSITRAFMQVRTDVSFSCKAPFVRNPLPVQGGGRNLGGATPFTHRCLANGYACGHAGQLVASVICCARHNHRHMVHTDYVVGMHIIRLPCGSSRMLEKASSQLSSVRPICYGQRAPHVCLEVTARIYKCTPKNAPGRDSFVGSVARTWRMW